MTWSPPKRTVTGKPAQPLRFNQGLSLTSVPRPSGSPGGSDGQESAFKAGDPGSVTGSVQSMGS